MSSDTKTSTACQQWEPLPPRGDRSNRARHRRLAAATAGASEPPSGGDNNDKHDIQQSPTASAAATEFTPNVCNPRNNDNNTTTDASNKDRREKKSNKKQKRQQKKQDKKPQPRKNRPGFSSYLKVILDDVAIDRLHAMALQIQDETKQAAAAHANTEDTATRDAGQEACDNAPQQDGNSGDAVDTNDCAEETEVVQEAIENNDKKAEKQPKKRKKSALKFKPRSRDSLHMTLFFGGETLCELPAEELVEWHSNVGARLAESGFVVGIPADAATDNNQEDEFWFRVMNVRMFPPHRNNLVVAVLEASPSWHTLHGDIRTIAKQGNSKGLQEIMQYSKEKWIAHITLGNLFGGSKAETKELFRRLQELSTSSSSSASKDEPSHMFKATAKAIAMGGPVPEQAELDWMFRRRPIRPTT